jgi:hypothetical protein
MRPDTLIRTATATVLDLTAATFRTLAGLTDTIAGTVKPGAPDREEQAPASEQAAAPEPTVSADDADTDHHVETDLQVLVRQPAPEVIGRLGVLSDAELADLYQLESDGRRRAGVLRAITEASAPPPQPATPELPIDEVDISEPAELVYSTETSV